MTPIAKALASGASVKSATVPATKAAPAKMSPTHPLPFGTVRFFVYPAFRSVRCLEFSTVLAITWFAQ